VAGSESPWPPRLQAGGSETVPTLRGTPHTRLTIVSSDRLLLIKGISTLGGIAFGTVYGLLGIGFLVISVYGLLLTATHPGSTVWDWLSIGWLFALSVALIVGLGYALIVIPRRVRAGDLAKVAYPSVAIAAGNGVVVAFGAVTAFWPFVGVGLFFMVVYLSLVTLTRASPRTGMGPQLA
jgi:hypothetical protein